MPHGAPRIALRANVISEICKSEGISRDELARRVGVTSVSAYRLDAGRSNPSAKFVAGLIVATGRSFDDLFVITETEDAA